MRKVNRLEITTLYPIVDVGEGGGAAALALAEALLAARPAWLQLRCKTLASADFVDLARRLAELAVRTGTRLIINDRADIAVVVGAAGVHLGQDDLPIAAARRVVGPAMAIGISTHTVAEARQAEAAGADYIGFGPMFVTGSKSDALTPRSLDELSAVRRAVALPIVAIGGIGERQASRVLEAGADAVAMIGALQSSSDPEALARRLMALPRARMTR